MQREWKDRVLYALELALRVADREGRSPRKTVRCNGAEKEGQLVSEGEREALGTLILSRVVLQMENSLRGHPNYRKACRVLEELPLWSLDKETALQVIDRLSSILGLPFRYAPTEEARAAYRDVDREGRPSSSLWESTGLKGEAFKDVSLLADVERVVHGKIEQAKELLGGEGIVK